jgi:hypothetical protein
VANAALALGVNPGARCATLTRDPTTSNELQLGIAKARASSNINWAPRRRPRSRTSPTTEGRSAFVDAESFGKVDRSCRASRAVNT